MPLIRCPKCAQRQLVSEPMIGHLVGCSRCERTFMAQPLSSLGQLRDLLMMAAALTVGGLVAWFILRGGA